MVTKEVSGEIHNNTSELWNISTNPWPWQDVTKKIVVNPAQRKKLQWWIGENKARTTILVDKAFILMIWEKFISKLNAFPCEPRI